MRESVHFTLGGVDALNAKLRRVGPEVATKGGASAVRAGTKFLAGKIADAAPVGDDNTSRTYRTKSGESVTVDYGHLRDNIKFRKGKARKEYTQVSQVGVGEAFWGLFLEFGTEKMAPQAFMKPAVEANSEGALQAMLNQLSRYLDRYIKKKGL